MKASHRSGSLKEGSPVMLSKLSSFSNRDITISPEGPKEKHVHANYSGKSSMANIFENNLSQFNLETSGQDLLQRSASSHDLDTQLIYDNSSQSLSGSPRKWLSSNLLPTEREEGERKDGEESGLSRSLMSKVTKRKRIIIDSGKSSSSHSEITELLSQTNKNDSEFVGSSKFENPSQPLRGNQLSQGDQEDRGFEEEEEEKEQQEAAGEEEGEVVFSVCSRTTSRVGSAKERTTTPLDGTPIKQNGSVVVMKSGLSFSGRPSPVSGRKALPLPTLGKPQRMPQQAARLGTAPSASAQDKKPLRFPNPAKKGLDPRVAGDASSIPGKIMLQTATNTFQRKKTQTSQRAQKPQATTEVNFFQQQEGPAAGGVNYAGPNFNSVGKRQSTAPGISSNVENFILLNRFDMTNHRENIKEYLRRAGLPEDRKIFCFNSQDEHIRRALLNRGWVENKNSASLFFDLKWVYNDTNDHYSMLNDSQFFNHFQGNRVITSKAGLTSTLRASKAFLDQDCDEFYPRCFDLGSSKELNDFKLEFLRNSILIILRKLVRMFKKIDPKAIARLKSGAKKQSPKASKNKKEGFLAERLRFLNSRERARRKKPPTSTDAQTELLLKGKDSDAGQLINISLTNFVFKYCRFYSKQIRSLAEEDISFDLDKIPAKVAELIQEYAKTDLRCEGEAAKKPNINMTWSAPSSFCIEKLYKYYCIIKAHLPQWQMDGTQNIWIIKPAQSSKGSGIHLIENLPDALESGFNMGARIIQKYIEKPLIVNSNCPKNLRSRKFDIRQWVLVKSFSPLKSTASLQPT